MKKLLLIAILMLALVLTVAACKTEPTTETTAGETTVAEPVDSTAKPDDTTAAPAPEETTAEPAPEETTAAPVEVTTEEETTEEVTTEEVTTADPAEPVWIIDADGLAAMTGANAATVEKNEAGYASFTATGGDPWFMVTGNIGAMPEYLVIRYRTNTTQTGEIFIGNGAGPEGGKSFVFSYNANSEWNLLVFHLPTVAPYMTDNTVGHIRYDFYTGGPEEGASLEVEYMAFFNTAEYAIAYGCAPGYLTTPEDLLTRFNEGAGTAVNQVGSAEIMTEGGASFIRLTANGGDPYICAVPFGQSIAAPYYMGIAYRTNSALEGHFFIGSTGGWSGAGDHFSVTWEEGGWTYQVIDLTATGVTTLDLENPVLNYCRMDFFGSQPAEGEYFDVAFVGFFESANDATAYCELNGLQLKDIKNTFVADVNANEIGTGLNASDLKNYFTVELPVGSEGVVANGEGKMYSMTAISNMFADVAGKYFIKANNLTADKGFMFVRGYKVVNSDEITEKFDPAAGFYKINNYFETDTVGQMGGAGIYAAIENGSLTIMVKYYNAEAITRVGNKMYTLPVDGTELIMADNGDVVSIIVNGKLCATIALSGSVAYADINEVSPAGNFAASAVVTLADGTTETIENTLIADTCVCQVGVVTRGGHFRFDALEVGAFSAIEIPSFPEAPAETILNIGENTIAVTDEIIAEGGVAYALTVTEAGNYTFEGDFSAIILDADGNMVGRGMASLEAGTYTINLSTMVITEAGNYNVNVVYTAPDAE